SLLYPLSLHDALPISRQHHWDLGQRKVDAPSRRGRALAALGGDGPRIRRGPLRIAREDARSPAIAPRPTLSKRRAVRLDVGARRSGKHTALLPSPTQL